MSGCCGLVPGLGKPGLLALVLALALQPGLVSATITPVISTLPPALGKLDPISH